MHKATALILAGGRSSRLGTDKALVKIKDNEETLVEMAVRRLTEHFDEILLSANDAERFGHLGVKVVADIFPGNGPLSGIHTGLKAAAHEYTFVVACDMPFFSPFLAGYLLNEAIGYDAVVPRVEGYLEPLHAVYAKSCIAPIEEVIKEGNRRVAAFYPLVRVKYVGGRELQKIADADRVFFNINTGEDLDQARKFRREEKKNTEG